MDVSKQIFTKLLLATAPNSYMFTNRMDNVPWGKWKESLLGYVVYVESR